MWECILSILVYQASTNTIYFRILELIPFYCISNTLLAPNILNYSIKIKGVVFMEQGIIVYQDPKEFLKVIEQLQEQYNNKQ